MSHPYKDIDGQWWCDGKKVTINVLDDKEKIDYVQKQLGGVGEGLKPSDCKSDADGYAGSNPAPSTNLPNM